MRVDIQLYRAKMQNIRGHSSTLTKAAMKNKLYPRDLAAINLMRKKKYSKATSTKTKV